MILTHILFAVLLIGLNAGCVEAPGDDSDPDEMELILRFRAGSLDGDLAFGEIIDVAQGPSGSLYVLEWPEPRITVLSSRGELLRQFGQRGEGPGELTDPGRLGWVADTLWILDTRNYRFTLFDRMGELVGLITPTIVARQSDDHLPPRPVALLPQGRILARGATASHLVATRVVDSIPYFILDREGAVVTQPFRVVAHPPLWIRNPDSSNPYSGRYTDQPFLSGPYVDVSSSEGSIARARVGSDSIWISSLDLELDTRWTTALPAASVPISESVIDSIIGAEAQSFVKSPAAEGASILAIREWIREALVIPDHWPLLEEVVMGEDGSVWVKRRSPDRETYWIILGPEGNVVGQASSPAGVEVLTVSKEGLVGVTRDEFDVPYVVAYDLRMTQ